MSANRVVILLSPIFVGVAGAVVTWVAKNFPGGPTLNKGELTAVFIAGATFAAGKVAMWVRGWQQHEAQGQAIERAALASPPTNQTSPRSVESPPPVVKARVPVAAKAKPRKRSAAG